MFSKQQVQQLLGSTVHDSSGAKVGKVEQVYLDDNTDQPEWITVRTGMFGRRESFVPLERAQLDDNGLTVPVDREAIKGAPQIDAGQQLPPEREAELYRHYGIDRSRGAAAGQGQTAPGRSAQDRSGAPAAGPAVGSPPRGGSGSAQQDVGGSPTPQRETQPAGAGPGAEAGMAGGAGTAEMRRPGSSMPSSASGPRGGAATTQPATGTPATDADTARTADMPQTRRTPAAQAASETAPHPDSYAMTRSEERLDVGTEEVETGRARLRKHTVTEHVHTTVPVSHEEVRLEREPITDANRDEAMAGPEMADDEHEVVLHAEQPVIHKHTEPVERVRLRTERVREDAAVDEDVRSERIDLEQPDGSAERGENRERRGRHER